MSHPIKGEVPAPMGDPGKGGPLVPGLPEYASRLGPQMGALPLEPERRRIPAVSPGGTAQPLVVPGIGGLIDSPAGAVWAGIPGGGLDGAAPLAGHDAAPPKPGGDTPSHEVPPVPPERVVFPSEDPSSIGPIHRAQADTPGGDPQTEPGDGKDSPLPDEADVPERTTDRVPLASGSGSGTIPPTNEASETGDEENQRLLERARIQAEYIHAKGITSVSSRDSFSFISPREDAPHAQISMIAYSGQDISPVYEVIIGLDDQGRIRPVGRISIEEDGTVREHGDLSLLFGTEENPANQHPYRIEDMDFEDETGANIMGHDMALEALHKLRQGLGDTWPEDITLPDVLGADTSTDTIATLYKSVADVLATRTVNKFSSWQGKDATFFLATTVENGNPVSVLIGGIRYVHEEDEVIRYEHEELTLSSREPATYVTYTNYSMSEISLLEDRARQAELLEAQQRSAARFRQLTAQGYPAATAEQVANG